MNYYQHDFQNYADKSATQTFLQQKQMKDYAYKNYVQELKNRDFDFLRNQKCPIKTKETSLQENHQEYASRRDSGAVQKNQFQQTSNDSFRKRVEENKTQSATGKKSPNNGLSDVEDAKHLGWDCQVAFSGRCSRSNFLDFGPSKTQNSLVVPKELR